MPEIIKKGARVVGSLAMIAGVAVAGGTVLAVLVPLMFGAIIASFIAGLLVFSIVNQNGGGDL